MSLGIYVLKKDRLSKEMETSLDLFLKMKRFVKKKCGSFFYYSYGGKASIDIFITKTPMKDDGP